MEMRLLKSGAAWLLLLAASTTCMAQRLPERDPRTRSDDADTLIRDAIKENKADPQVTRVAEESLRSLIWWERRIGLKYGPEQLERFLNGKGGDIKYGPTSPIAEWTREHEAAQYSHQAAHENATKRIQNYIEREVRGGRTSFPSVIPLESIGFVKDYLDKDSVGYKDRLQGPTLYQKGKIFSVPAPYLEVPLYVVELIVSFGDLQGPHDGVINNLKLNITEKEGKKVVLYDYTITYTWNDRFTFDNDSNMSHYDAAAHYLEFIAKTAKAYKTSVVMKEKVRGSVTLNDAQAEPSAGSNPGAGNPVGSNPVGSNPNGDHPGEGDSQPGVPGAPDPTSPLPGSPSSDGDDHDGGAGAPAGPGNAGSGNAGPGKSNSKLPPIHIPHPPGWGVKLKSSSAGGK